MVGTVQIRPYEESDELNHGEHGWAGMENNAHLSADETLPAG